MIPAYPKQIKGITKFGEFDFTEPQYPESLIIPAKHCAGIPLTEEILLKAGAKDGSVSGGYEIEIDDEHALALDAGELVIWCNDSFYNINTHKKYVHQLQNLYFALTGNELEIKL